MLELEAAHQGAVLDVACSHSNDFLASSSVDHTLTIWRLKRLYEDAGPKQTLQGNRVRVWSGQHDSYVQAVSFSSPSAISSSGKGLLLASVGGDRICRIWDVDTGNVVHLLKSTGALTTVVFSPSAETVAAGGLKGTLSVWDVKRGKNVEGRPHPVLLSSHASVSSVSFTPDSRALVVAGTDGILWAWDFKAGKFLGARCNTPGSFYQKEAAPDAAARQPQYENHGTSSSAFFFPEHFLSISQDREKKAAASRETGALRHAPPLQAQPPSEPGGAQDLCVSLCVCGDNEGKVHIFRAHGLESSPMAFSFGAGAHMHFQKHHASHQVQTLYQYSAEWLISMVRDHETASLLKEATELHKSLRALRPQTSREKGVEFARGQLRDKTEDDRKRRKAAEASLLHTLSRLKKEKESEGKHASTVLHGWLWKLNSSGAPSSPESWRHRLCLCADGVMSYISEKNAGQTQKVCNLANISEAELASYPEANKHHAFILSFFNNQSITFAAETAEECSKWLSEIVRVLQGIDEEFLSAALSRQASQKRL